ncbi:spore germination protein [Paenibacillus sp. Aloe-11]|uniref:spore germination protein n=1 Tax=Paenibacillus sp. Aloe-11 TaxID=1050222 RepID=UPI00024F0676|nr:spore germination protein [Paenibacillus sp. Aloe-11]EHS57630.1 GerA spore germination protein [Paenibacillus sp. Aloe-11]
MQTRFSASHGNIELKDRTVLVAELDLNVEAFQRVLGEADDVSFRSFLIGGTVRAELVNIPGMSDRQEIDTNVLRPLMQSRDVVCNDLQSVKMRLLPVISVDEATTVEECAKQLIKGNPVLLIDGCTCASLLGLAQWDKRNVEEPQTETSLRGPREGFTESISTNLSQLRRRIQSIKLQVKSHRIGSYTGTEVCIAYIDGLAKSSLLHEVQSRLERIDIDSVLETGYIEELTEDNPYSPFPQQQFTERVDVAVASLLEGRVVLLVDGTPDVLIVPATLATLLQAADDYYNRTVYSSFLRFLRYWTLILSMILPAVYVAILNFHHEMVPGKLLVSIASAREEIPFPTFLEVMMMQLAFEVLREAGLRLPRQIGSAVTIVGALVVGEAAVSAGLVSAPIVIIIAFTGIAGFTAPHYSIEFAIRLLRLPLIILGGTLGMLGVMFGVIAIATHLCMLRSYGVPFLSPFAPFIPNEMMDTAIRAPRWKMSRRPGFSKLQNRHRLARGQKPGSGRGGGN